MLNGKAVELEKRKERREKDNKGANGPHLLIHPFTHLLFTHRGRPSAVRGHIFVFVLWSLVLILEEFIHDHHSRY